MEVPTMHVEIQPALAARKDLAALVEAATDTLRQIVGNPHASLEATWELNSEKNLVLRLAFPEWKDEITEEFTLAELRSHDSFRRKCRDLWSNLIHSALHRRIEALDAVAWEEVSQ
jgi:hypothetical protein